ncbi:MAG: fatty acid desaturase [Pyrinomonadaceae bacterium]|nr:fatty acid desaturase [Pyrinomonadaceae bacterium]
MRKQISSLRTPGFLLMHAACLLVIWSGVSWVALYTCLALYLVRMIGITAGYHHYFSHRTYQTSRLFQFFLALLGTSAAQQGPLWWAAHHRYHHSFPTLRTMCTLPRYKDSGGRMLAGFSHRRIRTLSTT